MEIIDRQYIIKKCDDLSSEYIENHIFKPGFEPLRWAIVNVDNGYYVIDAVVIQK